MFLWTSVFCAQQSTTWMQDKPVDSTPVLKHRFAQQLWANHWGCGQGGACPFFMNRLAHRPRVSKGARKRGFGGVRKPCQNRGWAVKPTKLWTKIEQVQAYPQAAGNF
jgi:hypothetical protein